MPRPVIPTFTQPYQVTADDKDFLTLSANLQVNYQDLRAANPYVQSLSQGQYINIPAGAQAQAQALGTDPQSLAAMNYSNAPAYTPAPRTLGVEGNVPGLPRAPSQAYNMYGPTRGAGASTSLAGYRAAAAPYTDYAQRAGVSNFNISELGKQFAATGTLPPNLPPSVIDWIVSQGGDPAKIRQAMQKGAQTEAAANDPLRGTPGHYYVDEKTAPLVGTIISLKDGRRRRLLTDKNGRLYYGKVGQNRRGRARWREKNAARLAAQVQPASELRETPVTALNVVMGS